MKFAVAIDADGALADGLDVELGPLDKGLELLGEERPKLFYGQRFKVDSPQTRQK